MPYPHSIDKDMNYELAKQLKDAGFSQELKHGTMIDGEDCDVCGNHVYYVPTLSELIEACGEERTIRIQSYWEGNDLRWQADTCGNFAPWDNAHVSEVGSTPEEAVARLWLALNPNASASLGEHPTTHPTNTP